MQKIGIFPGSFDPFTKGHEDIALRGATLFDTLIIAVGKNANKKRFFPLDETIERIREVVKNQSNIVVESYEGLTATFAKQREAKYILRGLRNTTDFEYENTISQGNKHLNSALDTVFLITDPKLAYISSSIVREIHSHGGDTSPFMPYKL